MKELNNFYLVTQTLKFTYEYAIVMCHVKNYLLIKVYIGIEKIIDL